MLGLLMIAVLAIAMGPRAAGACTSNTHDHHRCDEAATAPLCCECGAIPRPVTVTVDQPVEVASPIVAADDLAPATLTLSPEPPPPKR